MSAFNKKKFLAKLGVKNRTKVSLPDGDIWVKALTCLENEQFEDLALGDNGRPRTDVSVKAIMAIMTAEDESGEKIFTMDDLDLLNQMPAADINKLFSAAQKLNNISDEDIKELQKN